ncbi:ABC transporter ATP-binding protein [Nocardia jejuensis]|uniref:ABC transporter ATP-binding protein n=1 Tax=Nocardia jejuensis TaxID=328049 RepID=UPI00082E134B|nr:ATP-binding cassette domain-containing protein [Nocardia jejuensis]
MIELSDFAVTGPAGAALLTPICLRVPPGGITALTGPSGAGKSTLLRAMLGHLPARTAGTGALRVGDHRPLELNPKALRVFRREQVTYTGQDPAAALNPTMRVRALLTEYATLDHAEQALAAVQLPTAYLRRRPTELSGGEQRRVALARALARRTPVLLLDEPFAGLHSRLRNSISELLRAHVTAHGTTLLLSGHHHEALHDLADDTIALHSARPITIDLGTSAAPNERSSANGAGAFAGAANPSPPVPDEADPLAPIHHRPTPDLGCSTNSSEPEILSVVELQVVRGKRVVLDDIELTVRAGQAVAVAGPSGAGKSTLARAVVGLQNSTRGRVRIDGRVGFVPQDSSGSLNPRRTIAQALRRSENVAQALARVELNPDMAQRYPHELSGGQRQRVALARALATDPALLVCDEITSALDDATAESIMTLLDRLRREEGLTLLVVSHDMPLIARYCTLVHVLESGRIVESGAVATVLDDPRHEATLALIG